MADQLKARIRKTIRAYIREKLEKIEGITIQGRGEANARFRFVHRDTVLHDSDGKHIIEFEVVDRISQKSYLLKDTVCLRLLITTERLNENHRTQIVKCCNDMINKEQLKGTCWIKKLEKLDEANNKSFWSDHKAIVLDVRQTQLEELDLETLKPAIEAKLQEFERTLLPSAIRLISRLKAEVNWN